MCQLFGVQFLGKQQAIAFARGKDRIEKQRVVGQRGFPPAFDRLGIVDWDNLAAALDVLERRIDPCFLRTSLVCGKLATKVFAFVIAEEPGVPPRREFRTRPQFQQFVERGLRDIERSEPFSQVVKHPKLARAPDRDRVQSRTLVLSLDDRLLRAVALIVISEAGPQVLVDDHEVVCHLDHVFAAHRSDGCKRYRVFKIDIDNRAPAFRHLLRNVEDGLDISFPGFQ